MSVDSQSMATLFTRRTTICLVNNVAMLCCNRGGRQKKIKEHRLMEAGRQEERRKGRKEGSEKRGK